MTSVETGSASASASISASSTSSLEAVTPDGLVQKRIVVTGEGEPVGRGAKVTISYKVFFEGREIDSSSSLTFTQGRKKVIAALDIVVQGMCVGEKAIVQSGGAYAFGRRGLKRKNIGPDSDVEIHVQLLSAEGGEKKKALAEMSSRELYEEALQCKETGNALFKEVKYEKAMSQYSQCIRFVNHLMYKPKKSKETDDSNETKDTKDLDNAAAEGSGKEQEFTEATVVEEEKEKREDDNDNEQNESDQTTTDAGVTADGETEAEADAKADAKAEVKINEVADAKTLLEPDSENAEEGDTKQDEGEEKVKEEDEDDEEIVTVDATSGVGIVVESQTNGQVAEEEKSTEAMNGTAHADEAEKEEEEGDKNDDDKKEEEDEEEEEAIDQIEIKGLHVTALNNLSLCLVKMEDYKRAVESTTVALEVDPNNSKAFYYRGRALICLGEWDKAKEDLMAARKLQPNNVGIRMELTKLEKKIKSFQNLERRQAAAMFA